MAELLGTEVVLADEPVASLDLFQQQNVLRLLRRYAQNGRAVMLSIHDLALAARLQRTGQVDLSTLIQNTYPLERLQDALEESIEPGSYRIVVEA